MRYSIKTRKGLLFSATLSAGVLALAFIAPAGAAAGKVATSGTGGSVAPLEAKSPLSGGGTMYTYDVSGMKVHSPVPPAGFDPVTASAAKLAEYGFPTRPAGGQALRTWLAAMQKAHPATAPDHLTVWHPALRPAVSAGPAFSTVDSSNWSGNMATSEKYTNVYGTWLEPSIAEAECPADYQMESTWAGLGGWNTQTLVQAGTQYGEGQLFGSGLSNHQAWYEMINGTTNDFVPLPVTATVGGEMYVNIYRASSTGYNIYVENEYTGVYWGINFVSFSPYDGSTAEFIEEDPYGGWQDGVYLIRFGTFEVQDAEASINDSTFEGLANWPHDDVIMTGASDTMAYAGSAFNSGDSWYDYHEHCD